MLVAPLIFTTPYDRVTLSADLAVTCRNVADPDSAEKNGQLVPVDVFTSSVMYLKVADVPCNLK